jgi:hypothetical protein
MLKFETERTNLLRTDWTHYTVLSHVDGKIYCGSRPLKPLCAVLYKVMLKLLYRGADKSLAPPRRKQATAREDFEFIYPTYNHNWRNISTIYIYLYIKRLALNEIF